jgi:hypothetical protein
MCDYNGKTRNSAPFLSEMRHILHNFCFCKYEANCVKAKTYLEHLLLGIEDQPCL